MPFTSLKQLKQNCSIVLGIILLFCLIFGFQISGVNTRYLALFALILLVMAVRGKYAILVRLIKDKRVFSVLILSLLYFVLSIPITILHLKNDFSFFSESAGVLVVEVSAILFYSFFCKGSNHRIVKWLIIIYIIQSLIILGAFMSPNFLEIVRSFQYENAQEFADNYLEQQIFRGMALSGDLFFGLASSFGFALILTMYEYIKSAQFHYMLAFILLTIASFFVGRTSLVGFGIAIILYFISPIHHKIKSFVRIVFALFAIIAIVYVLLPYNVKTVLNENIFPYALEMFYNLDEGDGLSTNSTSELYDMLESPISLSTFLLGDGQFTSSTGEYYMQVDVGYFRQLYFSGIFYVLFSIAIIVYMIFPLNISGLKIRFFNSLQQVKTDFYLDVCILGYFLILQIKGLAMMHGKELMVLLMFYFLNKVFFQGAYNENDCVFHSTKSL